MKLNALFLGLKESRVERIVGKIEQASGVALAATVSSNEEPDLDGADGDFDAVFVSRDMAPDRLEKTLERVRGSSETIPLVLVYGSEPDGKAYLIARRYGCWLFSEIDRHPRTFTATELGDNLRESFETTHCARRLMEISLCSGPCSTGD